MEPMDIKIDYFFGHNHQQREISLLKSKFDDLLSLLTQKKGMKNEKNDLWHQN